MPFLRGSMGKNDMAAFVAHDVPIMSTRDAATYLNMSESWLAKRRWEGSEPRWVKLGLKRIGYRRSVLDAFLAACECSGTAK
jgi:predicted DNA-binding transcriptional regulator AlpA